MSGFWIIVPVKDTRFSKLRLGELFTAPQRQALAHAMLEDVLEAVAAVSSDVRVALVTVDAFAIALAQRHGFRVIGDGAHDGHTGAVDGGRRVVAREKARGMLTMPGDIPMVTAGEIEAVIAAHAAGSREPGGFTIVPSHDRQGSNAVAVSPPEAVPLRFGSDSFYPHLAAARGAGIEPLVIESAGIATDVDTPEDVARLMARDGELRSRAARLIAAFGSRAGDDVEMQAVEAVR